MAEAAVGSPPVCVMYISSLKTESECCAAVERILNETGGRATFEPRFVCCLYVNVEVKKARMDNDGEECFKIICT